MKTEERVVRMKQMVQAERERVFAALTEASRLREWFCDHAQTEPRIGGRYTLRWHSGYGVQGAFVELESPEEIAMIWQGLGEPGPTLVEWELDEEEDGVEVALKHVGFGTGLQWDTAYAKAEEGWATALENLQSVLEEGVDLREMRRPFLGVMLEDMDAERAEREGIATETGVYITSTLEGSAAEAAGIQKGDVIVALGGREVMDVAALVVALQASRAGDTVDVDLVRGQERITVPATLKGRELLEIPDDPAEGAARIRERHAQLDAALAEATAGLSEEEAEQRPAEGEWSVKEVLAHLSIGERGFQEYIAYVALGLTVEGEGRPWPDRMAATLAAEPTLAGLLERFARDQEETALLIEHLSEDTRADRYRYRQIVEAAIHYSYRHTEDHIAQIRQAVEAVRACSE